MINVFRQLVDNSFYPIWIKNRKLNYCYSNKKYADLHNKKIEEIIGLSCYDLYENNIALKYTNNCLDVLNTKKLMLKSLGDNDIYDKCFMIPIKDNYNEVIAIAAIMGLTPNINYKEENKYVISIQNKIIDNIIDMLTSGTFYKNEIGKYIYNNDVNNVSNELKLEIEDKNTYREVIKSLLLHNKNLKESIIESIKIIDGVYNSEINEHSERVAENAVKIGIELGFNKENLETLRLSALLHDIGKICIDEEIFLKPGHLTEEEYSIMKTHSEEGYKILNASNEYIDIAETALYHHERWDGMGYPRGLKGNDIPIMARIISVCDSYDAMTTKRIYKNAMDKNKAIDELKRCSGSQFDPKIVDIFISKIY